MTARTELSEGGAWWVHHNTNKVLNGGLSSQNHSEGQESHAYSSWWLCEEQQSCCNCKKAYPWEPVHGKATHAGPVSNVQNIDLADVNELKSCILDREFGAPIGPRSLNMTTMSMKPKQVTRGKPIQYIPAVLACHMLLSIVLICCMITVSCSTEINYAGCVRIYTKVVIG